jgi:quercetin dioxygenase-like cupin family protein
LLRVLTGSLELSLETAPPSSVRLNAGDSQALPPGVPHAVTPGDPVTLMVDFLAPVAPRSDSNDDRSD